MIREQYIAEPYQEHATKHIQLHRGSGLFMEMGLGKTAATLMAIVEMKLKGWKGKTLVIAPLTVAQDVWSDEIDKWDFTEGLTYSKVLSGKHGARDRLNALNVKADIYIINWENLAWLVAHYGSTWPFDYVIVDESSKFKSAKSKCFKSLRIKLGWIQRITILTGTPRPNSLMDLWSQLYLIDNGVRLGTTLGSYRTKYFKPGMQQGHVVFNYTLRKENKESLLGENIYAEEIYDKISDICISMSTKDYSDLPDRIIRTKYVSMADEAMNRYRKFEKELIMEIDENEITPANAAVMTGKLLQFSNGAIYDDKRKWHKLHDTKLDALEEIMEEANGQPVLVMYQYRHDLERILERFKGYKPRIIKDSESKRDWNAGKINMGIGHAKSMGHGNNLQAGGCIIVWFGLGWSLELYDQANKRLHRRGQLRPVIQYHILCKNTMDKDVLTSLTNKHSGQAGCMRALKARIKYYRNNKAA